MLFSSSSFSVSMDRIKACAAHQNIDEDESFFPALMLGKLTCGEAINSDDLRFDLHYAIKSLLHTFANYKNSSNVEPFYSFETEYGKTCLALLKRENSPLSAEELALPFLVIDFCRLAICRFGNNFCDGELRISFEDAVEFICSLNMPKCLKGCLAEYAANKVTEDECVKNTPEIDWNSTVAQWKDTFTSHLNDSASAWRIKADKPCGLCLKELSEMHKFLDALFGSVAEPDATECVPTVLEAPYTLDKLIKNLLPFECPFHDIEQLDDSYQHLAKGEENGLRYEIVYLLLRLGNISKDDPYKSIKKDFILSRFNQIGEDEPYQDWRTGEYDVRDMRAVYEQDYPWIKAYFLWRDALNAGEDQNDCILPDALKGSCDCTEAYGLLHNEWSELYPEEYAYDISLSGLQSYFTEKDQAFKNFLLERCCGWESYLAIGYDDKASNWIKRELKDISCYARLFADSVPELDAPIEEIGDYLQKHAKDVRTGAHYNLGGIMRPSLSSGMDLAAEKYLNALLQRIYDEMEHIAGDENTPVYLRDHLIERFDKLFHSCINCDEYCNKVLETFRKDHEIKDTSSNFSDDIRKIKEMRDVEESKRRAELAEAAEAERRKVLFEMSHSIKNLMASVSEPLDMLKNQLDGTQRRTVENALAGAGLIRDLAVGVHMSMRGEPGTWRKDVFEPGFGAATLDKIILDAVRHAVSNMFDGKYFAQFVKNYFGRDLNTFMQAQNEWKAAVSAEDTFACINKYFFDFKIDSHGADLKIPIGDRDGTATKLLILFQELFLNAVKYSSFTEREKRFVKLDVAITPENWNIKLSNSAVGRKNTKSSGIGLAVIKNFADLFEAKYDASCKNDTYISTIHFSLNK